MKRSGYSDQFDEHGEYKANVIEARPTFDNVSPIRPTSDPTTYRAALMRHLNTIRAHEGFYTYDPPTKQYLAEAENILTKEEAMHTARAEVQDSYFKLQGERNRAHVMIQHLASLIRARLDPFDSSLSDTERQAAIHAVAIMEAGPFVLPEVIRQYMASSHDRSLRRASGGE